MLALNALIVVHAVLGVPFVIITVSATLQGFNHNLVRAESPPCCSSPSPPAWPSPQRTSWW